MEALMRSPRLSLAALTLACAGLASPAAASPDAKPAAPRPAVVERASRDWSEPPDFEALRAEYVGRADFALLCEQDRPLTPAFEALQAERWSVLLALTESWTERCPVDMEAHSLRAAALAKLGRDEEAGDQEMWARGLFEAVLASGDGKTPESGYRVIAAFEEYALLRAFRYPAERQGVAPNGADALTVLADGAEQTLYFDRLWTAEPRATDRAAPTSRVRPALACPRGGNDARDRRRRARAGADRGDRPSPAGALEGLRAALGRGRLGARPSDRGR
jgi:hypothetical protein